MLGHKHVPRDRDANLDFRQKLLTLCADEPACQKAVRAKCRDDILLWINAFVFQYNPNAIGNASEESGPFITWDFQDEALCAPEPRHEDDPPAGLIWCYEHRRDVVIVKSREMGASWLCILLIVWILLFHPRKKVLIISRNAEAVDRKNDPDSLFWKIDYVLRHLPSWMTKGVQRRKMGYYNQKLDTAVNGQASTGKAGVGGRASLIFVDEFSQIDEDYEVFHRTSDTSGCRIFNGTHVGTDKCFAEIADPDSTVGSYINRIEMHWTRHPDKRRGLYRYSPELARLEPLDPGYEYPADFDPVLDGSPTGGPHPGLRSPWYDDQCRRKGSSRAVAMDLDINVLGSVSQYFEPRTIRALQAECRDPDWEGELTYDRSRAEPLELVRAEGAPLKLWLTLTPDLRPPPAHYAAGVDVATGESATPSCLTITSADEGKKVLEYASSIIDPRDFADLCVALCRFFADDYGQGALLCWEMVGPGSKFGNRVLEWGYGNIYYRVDDFSVKKVISDKPGWNPEKRTKRLLLDEYRSALFNHQLYNPSTRALQECLRFKYGPDGYVIHGSEDNAEDPAAAKINHADRVIADALSWKMCQQLGISRGTTKHESKPGLGSIAGRRRLRELRRQENELYA